MAEWDEDLLCRFYRTMVTIRFFEQAVEKHFLAGEIPGFVHLYIGEEAIATGVCANLTEDDYIASTHRGHGHCIEMCIRDRIKAAKKVEMDAKKAAIRAEDIQKGVFVLVSHLPKVEPARAALPVAVNE